MGAKGRPSGRFISPNEMQKTACDHMLKGRKPETTQDWQLCVNFWAANVSPDVSIHLCLLMWALFECPLTRNEVIQIAESQNKRSKV